jgi:hypothetical protein
VHWSERILDEMTRNLVAQQRMDAAKAEALAQTMAHAFPDAMVEGWEAHEPAMRNHAKDRHVAAAAVAAGATVIVTSNLKDFRKLPDGISAMIPDAFLLETFERDPDAVVAALHRQAAGYRKPAATLVSLLEWLAPILPNFASAVANWAEG